MSSDYTIMSKPDDSVDLTVGDVRVRISAATWQEANAAAHELANAVQAKVEVATTRRRLRAFRERLDGLLKSLDGVEAELSTLLVPR